MQVPKEHNNEQDYEGSHWLTDVLGGYLSGAIFLGFLIFLYRRVMQKINERRAKKVARQAVSRAA